MNLTALALFGMAVGVGQPPADYYPVKSRTLTVGIEYQPEQRRSIQRMELCVSRDQGQTWGIEAAVTPDQDHFVFTAKEDGIYWLTNMIVFRDGRKDPPDITRLAPDRIQKVLVDSTAPLVRMKAQRIGDEVAVEWEIEDKFPNDSATQVLYKPIGPAAFGDWQAVPTGSIAKRTARFKPGTTGPIAVQVATQDLAGNPGSATPEVPAGTTVGYMAPAGPARPDAPSTAASRVPENPIPPPSLSNITGGGGPLAPTTPLTQPPAAEHSSP